MLIKTQNLCGRQVISIRGIKLQYRDYNPNGSTSPLGCNIVRLKCSDCNQIAKELIIEENGTAWPWCGQCAVGG
jgi:hypothetical protein